MAMRDINGYSIKIVDMGDWDMDAGNIVSPAHGLSTTEVQTIRRIEGIIRQDAPSANLYPLGRLDGAVGSAPSGGVALIGSSNLDITRLNAGNFDAAAFSDTGYNRGWVTIEYIAD